MKIVKLPPLRCSKCNSTSVVLDGKKTICVYCNTTTDNSKEGKGKVSKTEANWWVEEPLTFGASKKEIKHLESLDELKEFEKLTQGEKEDYRTPEYFEFFIRDRRVA
jgi:hypothetical protein